MTRVLHLTIPGSPYRSTRTFYSVPAHALPAAMARAIKGYALARGVSPLAIDWSVS